MAQLINALRYYVYNSFISKIPFYAIRQSYLERVLKIRMGKHSAIHMRVFITGNNIEIGSHTILNRDAYLDGRGSLCIGNNVSISPQVYILTMTHDAHNPDFAPRIQKTIIEDYVWIGVRALILPGVRLGKGAIVGAGSIVTKDVAPFSIVAGNPARLIGERKSDLRYTLSYKPWFDTDVG